MTSGSRGSSSATRGRRSAVGLVGLVLLTACSGGGGSGSSLSSDDFAAGTCQQAAGPVIAADKAIRSLTSKDTDLAKATSTLTAQQAALISLRPTAGAGLEPHLAGLTNAIGVLRVGAATGTYTDKQAQSVAAAISDVVGSCKKAA